MQHSAPFPYFGAKHKVAQLVWSALGNVGVYVEPFAGSLAVLLARPHKPRIEIVNDADCFIANFWRAVKYAPDEVAYWANWPINEADLHARHIYLVQQRAGLAERIMGNPDYYDARIAGWWVWGQSIWLGSGWCRGDGPWTSRDGQLVKRETEEVGIKRQKPVVEPKGIHCLSRNTTVNAGTETGEAELRVYLQRIAERLRHVVVLCGDWERAVTPSVLRRSATIGIFLDPPYSPHLCDPDVFAVGGNDPTTNERVYYWCIEHQYNYRIVLAGYAGEYNLPGWKQVRWTSNRGYAGADNANRYLQTLWLSPLCKRVQQLSFWDAQYVGS